MVLAAGASRRLGEPKALADLGGRSALARLCAALAADGGAPVLVVTGRHDAEIRAHAEAEGLDVELLHNPDWERGRTSSVARAARRWPGADLLVAPVDVPLVSASLVAGLVAEWDTLGRPARGWLAPCVASPGGVERRFGHPVVLGAELAQEAADLAPDRPLRLLRERAAPLASLDTDDAAILDDLDTASDLAALRRRLAGAERPT